MFFKGEIGFRVDSLHGDKGQHYKFLEAIHFVNSPRGSLHLEPTQECHCLSVCPHMTSECVRWIIESTMQTHTWLNILALQRVIKVLFLSRSFYFDFFISHTSVSCLMLHHVCLSWTPAPHIFMRTVNGIIGMGTVKCSLRVMRSLKTCIERWNSKFKKFYLTSIEGLIISYSHSRFVAKQKPGRKNMTSQIDGGMMGRQVAINSLPCEWLRGSQQQ